MNVEENNEEKKKKKEKKKIEIVNGNGSDLNISPVYEHIKSEIPSYKQKKGNIVIPKGSSDNKK